MVIPALGKLATWTERYHAARTKDFGEDVSAVSMIDVSAPAIRSWSEHQAREFLKQYDIPVIPGKLAKSAQEAVEAAREIGFPVALKIASPDIVHKSDIGGVKLGLGSEEEVRAAFEQVMNAASTLSPVPRIEGVLLSPMRSGGVELLVGVTRDAEWGQVLAVGLGGIWVEILKDTSLRVLPVSRDEIQTILTELQGAKLLQGARGSQAANQDALVEVIFRIAELAQHLKGNLESLEINPLRVDGTRIEALDAVITWK